MRQGRVPREVVYIDLAAQRAQCGRRSVERVRQGVLDLTTVGASANRVSLDGRLIGAVHEKQRLKYRS